MTTRLIKANALSTRHELVRGGEGKPRTRDRICEVGTSSTLVEVRLVGSFERLTFDPSDKVRVVA